MYYVTKDDLLIASYSGTKPVLEEGQVLHEGFPVEFDLASRPDYHHKWHVKLQKWVDTRSNDQLIQDKRLEVLKKRRAAYPELAEFADAMYWNAQGDSSKLDAYLAKCAEVKARFPKIETA